MKTILFLEPDCDPCSKFIFEDEKMVSLEENYTQVGDLSDQEDRCFKILDLNSSNAVIVEDVTPPEDWYGCKYNYVNDAWELCPDWVDPRIEREEDAA